MFGSILLCVGNARNVCVLVAALLSAAVFALPDPSPDHIATTLTAAREQVESRVAELDEAAARADAWGGLGMLYHANGRHPQAIDAYRRAIGENEAIHWHYLHAVVLADQGDVRAATASFRQALALADGRHMLASYRLGLALLDGGDHEAAAVALRDALAAAPESAAVLTALGDAEYDAGNLSDAVELLERAAALEPGAGAIAYKLALGYRQLGDIERTKMWLARRNDLSPPIDDPLLLEVAALNLSPKFFKDAGTRAWQRGEQDEAVAAWQRAAQLAPGDADAGLVLAHALGMTGREEEAAAEIQRVLARHPSSARGWYLRAWIARDAADDTARSAIDRALALGEDDTARTLSGALWMRAGRFMAAAEDYQMLSVRQPENAYYRYWLAMAYLAAGSCEAARPVLAEALRLQPSWGQAHIALARADALCGDSAARRAAAAKARRLLDVEDASDTRITLAWAELAIGHVDQANTIITPLLPHPDAVMLKAAIAAHGDRAINELTRPFGPESAWWQPEELR